MRTEKSRLDLFYFNFLPVWPHVALWYHVYSISATASNDVRGSNSVSHGAKSHSLKKSNASQNFTFTQILISRNYWSKLVFWEHAITPCSKLQAASSILPPVQNKFIRYFTVVLLQNVLKPHGWYKWRKTRLLTRDVTIIPEEISVCWFIYLYFQSNESSTPAAVPTACPPSIAERGLPGFSCSWFVFTEHMTSLAPPTEWQLQCPPHTPCNLTRFQMSSRISPPQTEHQCIWLVPLNLWVGRTLILKCRLQCSLVKSDF